MEVAQLCVFVRASLPTVLVLTLLAFREAAACHRSLGTQRRAGKTHVKIYLHWAPIMSEPVGCNLKNDFKQVTLQSVHTDEPYEEDRDYKADTGEEDGEEADT